MSGLYCSRNIPVYTCAEEKKLSNGKTSLCLGGLIYVNLDEGAYNSFGYIWYNYCMLNGSNRWDLRIIDRIWCSSYGYCLRYTGFCVPNNLRTNAVVSGNRVKNVTSYTNSYPVCGVYDGYLYIQS